MKRFKLIGSMNLLIVCVLAVSCVGTIPVKEMHFIDSLNLSSYVYRYKNLDSSFHSAYIAYSKASLYSQGRAEACNNLAFCTFMQMDFEKAISYYMQVYSLTKNEIELLIADIGLMKIYQRTSLNKEFYDYRNRALRRLKRIDEEHDLLIDKHERVRLNYARTEFYIVSAIYYYYLQQHAEALACIEHVAEEQSLKTDTNQMLYYHYIKAATALCDSSAGNDEYLREFDELYSVWHLASEFDYIYFEGNALQGLANLMASPESFDFFVAHRLQLLQGLDISVDSLLPMRLGQLALQKFRKYNDLYQIAGTYVTIGKYLNQHNRFNDALDTLRMALDCVNKHHSVVYHCNDTLDRLHVVDTVYVEQNWLRHKLKTVPEWILRIREQLSVTYAGLEKKIESDYNRNIYLDILEDIRQDKEQESRYQALAVEAQQFNVLLILVIVGCIVSLLFFVFFNKRSKARSRMHLSRMQQMLNICRNIIAAIPEDANREEEIVDAIQKAVLADLENLFGIKGLHIENRNIVFPCRIKKSEQSMVKMINPYIRYAVENGMTSISLIEEQRQLEKLRYVYERHIAEHKRQNIVKKACLSIVDGIQPYIDRIINEVYKLSDKGYLRDENIKKEKFCYLDELVDKIIEYNEVLTLWVKMKQGSISLNIENFALIELFDLIKKGYRSFEMKQLNLEIMPTDVWVKADKALTLFMINTLAENARKYTPRGGTVKIYASSTADYVEISIEDNGIGLSSEDVACILGEKVYNSKQIGIHDTLNQQVELQKLKGNGFGLMNCKGIIEKYRKTNDFFKVCLFGIDSVLGRGSRFYFRLPVGVRKMMSCFFCIVVLCGLASCTSKQTGVSNSVVGDSLNQTAWEEYEVLLDSASRYADYAYYSNVDWKYNDALLYIDSAIYCLNTHYKRFSKNPSTYMSLSGQGETAEIGWWNEMFDTDYHVILDIRNEAAVAFLALKCWKEYEYNNGAYTTLYKLLGEDQSLEAYCNSLERSTNNKIVGMVLGVAVLFALALVYYFVYYRKRLVDRWNLEQVLEINKLAFSAAQNSAAVSEKGVLDESLLKKVPQQIVNATFDAMNELLGVDELCMAVYNEAMHVLEYVVCPASDGMEMKDVMQQCFTQGEKIQEGTIQAFPLQIRLRKVNKCIGVLCLKRREVSEASIDSLLLELIVRYISIVVFNEVIKVAAKYNDIEIAHDEAHRASWEDSMLHVQNMVLDNCLSTIKHETMYYPNRIKQLVGRLCSGLLSEQEEQETVVAVSELIDYYNGIFTILSRCASRQLEEVTFRRSRVVVDDLLAGVLRYFSRAIKECSFSVELEVKGADVCVIGDANLLPYLFENLIDEALSYPVGGKLSLSVEVEDAFVRFMFTDFRRKKTQEELNKLFYPDLSCMKTMPNGKLSGTEYLICKQIIREHDEFAGRRGCRINATAAPNTGFTVYFTIPKK